MIIKVFSILATLVVLILILYFTNTITTLIIASMVGFMLGVNACEIFAGVDP
ncbi:hypothetical protein F-liban_226 [Faustovirus]|nr:hypothetical protein F-liban_226 [Faustovirus]